MCPKCFASQQCVYIPKSSGSDRAIGWSHSQNGCRLVLKLAVLLGGGLVTLSSINRSIIQHCFLIMVPIHVVSKFLFIHSARMFFRESMKRSSLNADCEDVMQLF